MWQAISINFHYLIISTENTEERPVPRNNLSDLKGEAEYKMCGHTVRLLSWYVVAKISKQ